MNVKSIAKRFWKVVLSPDTIAAFKVAGLVLQALHEIESHRNNHRGHKIGFKSSRED